VLAPDYWSVVGINIGLIAAYALIGAVLMYVGYFAIDLTTPGDLRALVREGRPNAVVVAGSGLVSMAFIVVTAIYTSSGTLVEGLLGALIFGLVGIIAQVGGVRLLEWVTGIRIGAVLRSEVLEPEAWVVAAAHVALGLVVAVAII